MSDLISREALRKAFHERIWHFDKSSWDEANVLIDNAPTVDYTFEEAFQKTVCENKLYCPARPQGEWIFLKANEEQTDGYECSVCKATFHTRVPYFSEFNFCPNCGADMRGGSE